MKGMKEGFIYGSYDGVADVSIVGMIDDEEVRPDG